MAFELWSGSGTTGHEPVAAAPWWHDERGWDDDDGWGHFPRRRPSRLLRLTGLVVAGALVLGSIGTLLEVVFGRSTSALPTSQATASPAGAVGGEGGASGSVLVTFVVDNPTGSPVVPVCTVSLRWESRLLEHAVVTTLRPVAAEAAAEQRVRLSVTSALPTDVRPVVSCRT